MFYKQMLVDKLAHLFGICALVQDQRLISLCKQAEQDIQNQNYFVAETTLNQIGKALAKNGFQP